LSGFVSRWVVAQRHDVDPTDLDAAGTVRTEALDRWASEACAAYLDECTVLCETASATDLAIRLDVAPLPNAALPGRPTSVVASAGANEFRPTSFTVAVRVRSGGGSDDRVVNLRAEVALVTEAGEETELGDAIRDELIALEHAARHTN
jgi:hypothetical protein